MDKKVVEGNIDNRTGGEVFLELVAKQAIYNHAHGIDKEGIKVAREVINEQIKFKPILDASVINEKEESKNNKNGRNKR